MTLYDQENDYGDEEPQLERPVRENIRSSRYIRDRMPHRPLHRPTDTGTGSTSNAPVSDSSSSVSNIEPVSNTDTETMPVQASSQTNVSQQGLPITQTSSMDCSYDGLLKLDSASFLSMDGYGNTDLQGLCARLGSFAMSTGDALHTNSNTEQNGHAQLRSIDLLGIRSMSDSQTLDISDDMTGGEECFDEISEEVESISGNLASASGNFDAESVYTQDKDGDTLLHTSIILQELALIVLFIKKAPSYTWLNIRNVLSQTPLHLAVLTNQATIVRKLITSGADITSRDKSGNTPLHLACRDGLVDIVKHLLEPVRYPEVRGNHYEIPYQRIPQDFSITNYEGFTCLHLAAMNGHLGIVELLVDKQVDLNMREVKTGRSILHTACIKGDILLIRYLLKHKSCNINARAYDGHTPFDLARCRNHDGIMMVLAGAGARYGDDEIHVDSD